MPDHCIKSRFSRLPALTAIILYGILRSYGACASTPTTYNGTIDGVANFGAHYDCMTCVANNYYPVGSSYNINFSIVANGTAVNSSSVLSVSIGGVLQNIGSSVAITPGTIQNVIFNFSGATFQIPEMHLGGFGTNDIVLGTIVADMSTRYPFSFDGDGNVMPYAASSINGSIVAGVGSSNSVLEIRGSISDFSLARAETRTLAELVSNAVKVHVAPNGKGGEGLEGAFTPNYGHSMAQTVAVAKQEIPEFDHFNWLQMASIKYPDVDTYTRGFSALYPADTVQSLVDQEAAVIAADRFVGFGSIWPGPDPGLGGAPVGRCLGDNISAYFDEIPRVCIQPQIDEATGLTTSLIDTNARFMIQNQTSINSLNFEDFPDQWPGFELDFHTMLVGVTTAGSVIPLDGPSFHNTSFNWTYLEDYTGHGGQGTAFLSANIDPTLGGHGTVTILQQTDVPEPWSIGDFCIALLGIGLLRSRVSTVIR